MQTNTSTSTNKFVEFDTQRTPIVDDEPQPIVHWSYHRNAPLPKDQQRVLLRVAGIVAFVERYEAAWNIRYTRNTGGTVIRRVTPTTE